MQKNHKQEMLALLGTMSKMADLLPSLANPLEQVQDCLAACECLRENLEQEAAPKSLELLQAIENSLKESKFDILENIKNLKSVFDSEVKVKVEALFLPYKASMWDSLESIYLAAKDDPNCDAFVMPIPYYDRKNGKLTEMHWETGYPKNIPLIDYRKYNIEERCPDMIFIHNPYDGLNTITSVHPDYYSDKLKNFTDCLVYVPYYTQRGSIDINAKLDDNHIWVPVFFNAHKIIVQTEQEKKFLTEGFKKYFGWQFGDPEKKFLALGSPKIDKIVNSKAEDFEIPSEWKNLIEADGAKKRVIFYNTSIAAILSGNEEYLDKLEYVLGKFKKLKEPILLWRPHPLSINTFETMRPTLLGRYLNIVEKYKSENYGIYDDSPDMNRALALSDAYYGDDSSIMTLWGFTGKPLMIQSLDFPSDGADIQSRLKFGNFRMDSQGNAWAWHTLSNGLFKLDVKNNTASLVATCDKKGVISQSPFGRIIERDEKLLNFASCGDFIMEFDPKTNEKRYIQLDIKHKTNTIGFVMGPVECNGNFYCFCHYSDSIIILRKDGSVAYQSQLYQQIGLKAKDNIATKRLIFALALDENGKAIFFDNYPAFIKDFKWSANMLCLFSEMDTIMKYNLETQKLAKIFSNKRFANAVQGIYDGKNIWISAREPLALLKVDLDKKNVMEFKNFPENFRPGAQNLLKHDALYIANCDSYLLLFPAFSNMILRFDKETNVFEEFKGLPIPVDWTANRAKYGGAFRIGKKVFALAQFNRILYELNLENGEISEHIFECSKDDYEKYFKGNFWHLEPDIKPEQFYAREENLLNAFHEFIENSPKEVKGQREAFSMLAENSDGTSGKAIYLSCL
ncbi:MAG: CDP-glycerol glycerophosphotransferase family protein [Fibromonadales bacterium]|nr:CDP-glycerol glycerophosphotransferase family protein [Fibromonadales bacterium]